MIAVIQRVSKASVEVEEKTIGSIGQGLLILLGIVEADTIEDMQWLAKKIANLRIFDDESGVMNISCEEVQGSYLVVSQFTLHANTKKGNRPSYIEAAKPEIAEPKYQQFVDILETIIERKVETGRFGADMKVALTNDGPVTLIIDTKNKH